MNSYSQVGQDLFALKINNNKLNGYFIDIGCHEPVYINNTFLLEQKGWNGLNFDIEDYSEKYLKFRKTKFIQCDALNFNFKKYFKDNNVPQIIDYLSLDIDIATYECLLKLPLDEYHFNCITIEHDEYQHGSEIKLKIRNYLNKMGYILHTPDVKNDDNIFEDWYVKKENKNV